MCHNCLINKIVSKNYKRILNADAINWVMIFTNRVVLEFYLLP